MKRLLQIAFTAKDKNVRITALMLLISVSINISGQKIQTLTTETWTGGNWLNSTKTSYTYDGSNYLVNSLSQTWNEVSSDWSNSSQINYTNYPDGTVNQSETQSWNELLDQWDMVSRTTFTYNSAKKILTSTIEISFGGDLVNFSRQTNTYDGSGYLVSDLSENWDLLGSAWTNFRQSIYTNNPNGTVSQIVTQLWDGLLSQWNNSVRTTFTYNLSNKISTTLTELYLSGNWQNLTLESSTYNVDGVLVSELSQDWVVLSGTWKDDTKTDYTYDSNGNLTQSITQTWDGVSQYVNTERFTYTYTLTTYLPEIQDEGSFILYPNPVSEILTVRKTNDLAITDFSIVDQAGKKFRSGKLNDDITTIDITDLPHGIYFLRIPNLGKNVYKFLKY